MSGDENPFDLGQDPDLEEGLPGLSNRRIAVIRTSDRMAFKRCRRRWGWQSHLRGSLAPVEQATPLWYGSGFHYALEDFHGPRKHPDAVTAFEAYVKATHRQAKDSTNRIQLPPAWPEHVLLGRGMLDYYTNTWLASRPLLKTFVWKGRPQVEVHIRILLPYTTSDYDAVYYDLTIDRVVIDEDSGGLFILDYKTAKRIQTLFFQTDPQITAYCWGASTYYGRPIDGFIYQQHRKDFPEAPRLNKTTGKLSMDKSQKTTHQHYRQAIIRQYGTVDRAPADVVRFLNKLMETETETQDMFVRRDRIFRNEHQVYAEGEKIMMEVEEMLNPDLPLYPNSTRECGNMCSFNTACVNMDDGSDWEGELALSFRPKEAQFDGWRAYLPEEFQ